MTEVQRDWANLDTVLLDVDGTLIDSTYLHALAWQRSFDRFGLTPLWWRVHHAIGMGGDRLVEQVCDQRTEDEHGSALRSAWAQEYRKVLDEVRPIEGAADTVRRLRRRGLRVAMASSGAAEFTDHALRLLGLRREEVDAVTTADDVDSSKPAPDILGVALDRSGGEQVLVVGDSTWDAEAAGRLGAASVGVRTGGIGADELRAAGAELVLDSVRDLPEVLAAADRG